MMSNRLRRQNWLVRYYRSLSVETQRWIYSCSCAVAINIFILVVLMLIRLALPQRTEISLEVSWSLDPAEELAMVEIPSDSLIDEPDLAEEMELEPEIAPEPEPLVADVMELVDELSEAVAEAEPLEVEPVETEAAVSSELVSDSSLAEMTSDSQRVAETERRVAERGGGLDGPVRVSLAYAGDDDVDLHVIYTGFRRRGRRSDRNQSFSGLIFGQSSGNGRIHGMINFHRPVDQFAQLDVDSNARFVVPEPCENIVFQEVLRNGNFTVLIDHFRLRGPPEPTPYVVVVKNGRRKTVYEGNIMPGDRHIEICRFKYRR